MISPLQFLITTPIPVSLDSLNIAPSKFVLYEFSGRGFHFLLTLLCVRGWLYSRLQISDIVFSVSSNFVQRHRVFLQLRLVSMVPNCLSRDSKKCQSLRLFPYFFWTRSLKEKSTTAVRSTQPKSWNQIYFIFSQPQRAWTTSSGANEHKWHTGSCRFFLLTRLDFVGKEFETYFQRKCFILQISKHINLDWVD